MYRESLSSLRDQVATKRELVLAKTRALPSVLRLVLPAELLARVSHEHAEPDATSLAALAAADALLDDALAAHQQIAALSAKARACPDEVPDPPRPQVGPPWAIEEHAQLAFRARLTRRLEALAPEAWLVRWGDDRYLSRFTLGGAPVIVLWDGLRTTARTSLPALVPPLEVRSERALDGVGRAIGLVRDLPTGDAAFDRAFIVDSAHPETVALLGPVVRAALMELRPLAPRIHLRRGLVDVTVEDESGEGAVTVALEIRAAIERG